MADVINVITIIFVLICWIIFIHKIVVNKNAKIKTVKAKVVDKYKDNTVSKYPETFRNHRYVIVFETENKRLSFDVSEFLFAGYKINEKGTLKYKGNKIISFK